jgi:predicted nucleic acid-binding protein
MIYLDTNIYIYAFCKNVDNQEQKAISQKILKEAVSQKSLIVSEVVLYEFAFVAKKLKENEKSILDTLQFLSKYKYNSPDISDKVIDLLEKKSVFKDSFDVYHVCFSNYYNCRELITFDNGFKRFQDFSITTIRIL